MKLHAFITGDRTEASIDGGMFSYQAAKETIRIPEDEIRPWIVVSHPHGLTINEIKSIEDECQLNDYAGVYFVGASELKCILESQGYVRDFSDPDTESSVYKKV